MSIIQKYNPISGSFDLIHSEDSFDDITVVANYSALPAVATVTGRFYWTSASQGTSWLPGSLGGTYYSAGLYYSNGVSWEFIDVPYQATQTEVNTGTNTNKFVTPETLKNNNHLSTATDYPTPLDADKIGIWDVANSLFKSVTFANLKATLKTYFDTLYRKNITVDAVTTTASHTGSTAETILGSMDVPANTFTTNDELIITFLGNTLGTAAAKEFKVYINTVPNLTGSPVQLGRVSTGATAVGVRFIRTFEVDSSTLLKNALSSTTNFAADWRQDSPYTTFTTDLTVQQYLILTGNLTSAADSILMQSFRVKRARK